MKMRVRRAIAITFEVNEGRPCRGQQRMPGCVSPKLRIGCDPRSFHNPGFMEVELFSMKSTEYERFPSSVSPSLASNCDTPHSPFGYPRATDY